MPPLRVLVCIDASEHSTRALQWTLANVLQQGSGSAAGQEQPRADTSGGRDTTSAKAGGATAEPGAGCRTELHLVTAMHDAAYNIYPMAQVAARGAVNLQWEAQKREEEQGAIEILDRAAELAAYSGQVPRGHIHTVAIPPAGGASGVAEGLVEYARSRNVQLAVLGSRGLGAVKRSFMSFVGLGSVSDYCLHAMPCPVLLVRGQAAVLARHMPQPSSAVPAAEAGAAAAGPGGGGATTAATTRPAGHGAAEQLHIPPPPRHVLFAADDSPHAVSALEWAMGELPLGPHDVVHVVAVANYAPASVPTAELQTLLEPEFRNDNAAVEVEARRIADRFAQMALKHGGGGGGGAAAAALKPKVSTAVLWPEGGASDVGKALCHYAKTHSIDLVVAGSRGMGAVRRSLMGLMGLGSVSDYLAHHAPCPLLVVKTAEAEASRAGAATASPAGPDPPHGAASPAGGAQRRHPHRPQGQRPGWTELLPPGVEAPHWYY